MNGKNFVVGVTGDCGWDLFTYYVDGLLRSQDPSDSDALRDAAVDLRVPSGTQLTATMMRQLAGHDALGDTSIRCLLPKVALSSEITTLDPSLIVLNDYRWPHSKNDTSCRVKQTRPFLDGSGSRPRRANPVVFEQMCCEESLPLGEIDLLFVQDLGGSWRDSGNGSESQHVSIASLGPQFSAFQLVNGFLNSGKTMPLVVVNVGRKLPEVNVNPDTGGLEFVQPFWQWLSRRPDQVCVMCSATAIRHGGAAVSRRLSWEQTVEDFATELLYFEPLRALTAFRHLIVRFGQVGMFMFTRTGDVGRPGSCSHHLPRMVFTATRLKTVESTGRTHSSQLV